MLLVCMHLYTCVSLYIYICMYIYLLIYLYIYIQVAANGFNPRWKEVFEFKVKQSMHAAYALHTYIHKHMIRYLLLFCFDLGTGTCLSVYHRAFFLYIQIHIHIHMYKSMHSYICICGNTLHVQVLLPELAILLFIVRSKVCTYVCMYIHICMYLCMWICAYKHVHS